MFWMLSAALAATPVIIDLEWRGSAQADHLNHGPGFGVGVGFFDDHLRVGLSGFSRPGPINPATFTLTLDEPYNGKGELALRSDGGFMGLYVAPGLDVAERVRLDFPVMFGPGGYGFYLVDEDRETPDGELPSVWEDALMDGRDSSIGLGVEGGARLTFAASAHLRPYVAVRYVAALGFDAYVADAYQGPSVSVGVSVGRF